MIFKKKDLTEKLGLKENDAKIIMRFQKELPILTDTAEGFCVDARDLYIQLKVKKDFSAWIKSKLKDVEANIEDDYIEQWIKEATPWEGDANISPQKLVALGYLKKYLLTIDTAKEIAMISGVGNKANEELREIGKMTRRYFIIIEKALKKIIEWNEIRYPERENYKIMCDELKKFLIRNYNKEPKYYDYTNEAEALNVICLGARSKDIKAYFNTKDKNTREHLLMEFNGYLNRMEELNIMYLRMNMDKARRYELIKQGFKVMYPNATFVMANTDK